MSKLPKRALLSATSLIAVVTIAGCAAEGPSKPSAASPSTTKTGHGAEPRKTTSNGPSCNPKEGAKAPALTVASMNGSRTTIAPGKVTLIDFWATWCKPCEKSFPAYQSLYTKYKDRGFEVIAVAVDDPETKAKIPGFVKTSGAKFPVGWDEDHALADCWKVKNMPSAYIIDRQGVVRHIHVEWKDDSEKKVEAQIKALL